MIEEHEFIRVKSEAKDTEQASRTAISPGKYVNECICKKIEITTQWEESS